MRGHKRKINSTVECGAAAEGDVRPPARQCVECGARDTPQWREGPKGPKTLCNACGVKRLRLIRKGVTAAQSPLAAPIVRPPSQRQSQKAHRQQQKEEQQQQQLHHDAVPGDHHGSDDSSGELDYSISGGHWNEAPHPQRSARQHHASASTVAAPQQAAHEPPRQQPAAGCQPLPLQQAGDVRDAALNLLSMASLQRPRTSAGAPSPSMPAQPAAAAHSSNPRKRAEAPAKVTYLEPRVSRRRRRLEPDCGAIAMPAARDEDEDEEEEDESEVETQEIIIHPDPELSRLRHLQGKAQEACHELNAANAACTAVAKILLEKQAAAARAKEQAERFVALLHEEMRALSAKLPLSTVARASASATAVAESAAAAAAAAAERQQQQPLIVAPVEVPLPPLPLFT